MTKLSDLKSFVNNLVNQLKRKDFVVEDCKKPENNYPLYWNAPTIDRGVRRVRLSSISNMQPKHAADSNIYHLSKKTGLLAFVLSVTGIEPRDGKEPLVRVAKIEGSYIVEQGQQGVRLAALLNRDYINALVIEYDYAALKKRMRVFMNNDGAIVGVAGREKGSYSYHGICPANMEVLIRHHRIPCQDDIPEVTVQKSAAGMARGGGATWQGRARSRSNLILLKR